MFFHDTKVYGLDYNLPSKANKTGEFPREVNKQNSTLPNEANGTSKLPAEANKRNINYYT